MERNKDFFVNQTNQRNKSFFVTENTLPTAKQTASITPDDAIRRMQVKQSRENTQQLIKNEFAQEQAAKQQEQERWDNLSFGEKIVDPFKTMGANIKYGDLGIEENQAWAEYRSKQDAESLAKAQAATKAREDYEANNDRIGKGNAFTKDFAQYLPQLGGQLTYGLGGAAAGAGAGAATGAGIGAATGAAAGGVGAAPGAIAGATTGALWGARGGYVAGTAKYSYDVMAGNAYKTLLDMGVPNDVALELSGDEAIINSLIEGGGAIVDLISLGIGKLGTKGATTATKKVAQSRLLAAAKAYGLNLATEPLEEMAQEKVSIETEKKAANVSGIERQATEAQDRERIKESGLGALKVSAIAGGGNVAGNIVTNKINDTMTTKAEQKQLEQDVKDLQTAYQTQKAMETYKKLSPYSKYQPAEVDTNISTKNIKPRIGLPEGGKIYVDENGVAVDSRDYVAPRQETIQTEEIKKKNELINKISNNTYLADEDKINLINQVNSTEYTDELVNGIEELLGNVNEELGLKNISNNFKDNKAKYGEYLRDTSEYDKTQIDNAKNSVAANKSGRRTKEQWLQVAKNLGSQIYEMSDAEIEKLAYKTWMDNKPNNKDNLNRQGQKYVKFGLDEWVNTVYDAVKKYRAENQTQKPNNILPTQAQNVNYSPVNARQVIIDPTKQENIVKNAEVEKNVAPESPTNDFQAPSNETVLPTQKIQETVNSAKIVGMSDFDVKKATDLHKMLQSGSNLKFYDSKNIPAGVDSRAINANGFYKDGTLWINKDSKRQVEKILGHELTHHLENTKVYNDFANTILDSNIFYDYINSQGYDNVAQFKENLRQRGYGDQEIDSEMVSMFVEDNLFDSQEKIDRLARENRTLAQKILNWLSNMKTKLVGTSQEKELLRIENMYRKALEQARENEQIDTKQENNKAQYSLKESPMVGQISLFDKVAIKGDSGKVHYKRIAEDFKRTGYVDLNDTVVRTPNDLAEVAQIFRDPRYETFRIIYVKGDKIVGYESISSKIPNFTLTFMTEKDGSINRTKNFYKISNRMERLGADGYYMVHNHPSGEAVASKEDIDMTGSFFQRVKGLKGHIIVNSGTYAWISPPEKAKAEGKYYKAVSEDSIPFTQEKNAIDGYLSANDPLEGNKLTSRNRLALIVDNIKNTDDYATIVMANTRGKVMLVKDMPKNILNMNVKDIKGYIRNVARQNSGAYLFVLTSDEQAFGKIQAMADEGFVADSILYDKDTGTTKKALVSWNIGKGIFEGADVKTFRVSEDTQYSLNDSEGRTLSKEQQEFFKDSKARDEDGNLQVAYHGTYNGEFYIFDRDKANPENDFGKGFYLTTDLGDVQGNYEGGGPDFDRKVSKLAERIMDEEDVDYDKAEEIARERLYVDSNLIEAYVNIKNPAIVGETYLFTEDDFEDALIDMDIDDYGGNEDAYYEDAEYVKDEYIANNILWGMDDVDGIEEVRSVIYEAMLDGGIGVQEFKDKMNEVLMDAGDEEGNLISSEVTRQIIENLGYDGIIDPTVSTKFNMHIPKGTKHYIVFNSNQIKNVDNTNPTENADIRYSINTKEDNTSNARALSRYAQTLQKKHKDIPEHVNLIQKEIDNGNFMHEVIRDKRSLNYAENYIKDNGFEDAVKHWDELMKRGKAVDKDELALGQTIYNLAVENKDTRLVMKMASDLVQEYTEIGRNLQSATLLRKMTPDGRLYALERSVQKINQDLMQKFDDFENIQIPEELADKLLNSETQKEMDVAVENIQEYIASQIPATWQEKLNSWRYLSMLGNPRTHIRNIVGNAVFVPAVEIKNKLSQAGELLIPKEQRTKATLTKKDSKLLKYAENDFDNNQETIRGESKYDIKAGIQEKRQIYSTKALEFARKGNFNLLEQEDKMFLKFRYKRAFAEALKARGITIEQLRENSPETVKKVSEIRSYAINEAQKATYRDASIVASMISRGKRKLLNAANQSSGAAKLGYNLVYLGAEGIMPFTKTPINIVKRGIEYSPAGLLNGVKNAIFDVKSGKVTAAQAIDKIAAGTTGTAIAGLGFLLSSMGLINGGEEEKDKEQGLKQLKGYQNYSLNVGGKSYTIDWTAPSSIPLFIGVELYNSITSGDESAYLNALKNITEPVVEMSMLQGINDTLQTMGEDDAIGNIVAKTLTNYLGQYNPTLLGQIARSIDPVRRTTYVDKNIPVPAMAQKFIQQQIAKIPGVSKMLPTYKDQFGQEQLTDGVINRIVQNFTSPGYLKDIKEGVVEKGITELYEKTGETSVIPSYASKSLTNEGEKINLTAKQYDTYAKTRGELSKKGLEGLFNSSYYKNLTDKQKVKIVEGIYDYANNIAKSKVIDGYELEANEKKIQKLQSNGLDFYKYIMLKKTADADGNDYTSNEELENAIKKYGLTRWESIIKEKNTKTTNTLPKSLNQANQLPKLKK